MPIFSDISTISCLSKPIRGLSTPEVCILHWCTQAMQGLRSHLAHALTGVISAEASALIGQMLRNPHHISAHDYGQLVMRAFFVDGQLDIREIDDMKLMGPVYADMIFARSTTFCFARSLV